MSAISTVQRSHSKQAYLALLDDPLDGIRHHVGVIFQAATQYSRNQQKHVSPFFFLRLGSCSGEE